MIIYIYTPLHFILTNIIYDNSLCDQAHSSDLVFIVKKPNFAAIFPA